MPYIARLEKAGIPTVTIDFVDQLEMIKQEGLVHGFPSVRVVHASRTLPGPEDVDRIIGSVFDALVRPLTEKEKEAGKWSTQQQRVLFEGTLDEAETYYQQTRDVPFPVNAPIAVYSDGFPIRVPIEERVREMLRGTGHRPDELITYPETLPPQRGRERNKGEPVLFQPMNLTATVEKVAINAVMAGCKPDHLPVVLAIAQSECGTGTTNFPSQAVCLSGPIVKELKMNTGVGVLGPGSPANSPIGRAYQLMAINLGGAVPGVNRMGSLGSPLNNGGMCFAENADGLPPGWKGLNEEHGYNKDESVVMVINAGGGVQGSQFSPGGYRAFQKSGHGGMARRFDVKGTPGPHNWLEYLVPSLWATREGAYTFIMVPEMARHLYDYGFKSKDEVYEWLWKECQEPLKDYRKRSWPDRSTNGWLGKERTSGKPWKELSDEYLVPLINDPFDSVIIVAGGEEEACVQLGGGREGSGVFSVDTWR